MSAEYKNFFKGKRITLMGLGLLGRGVGDARFFAQMGAELIVTDIKGAEELKPSIDVLRDVPHITFHLGGHVIDDFRGRDIVIVGPSVPHDSPFVTEARRSGAHVTMSAALFAKLSKIPIIGITGTRGKTTTTHMIAAILKADGYSVLLGGNVQGVSTISLLPETTRPNPVGVLELDSWQLQGFREEKLSPHIAVFTTFFPDHLNYYHNDLDAYLADKAEIFLHQDSTDTLVVGEQATTILKEKYGKNIRSQVTIAKTNHVPREWKLKIPGEHNRYNAACALLATRAFGASEDATHQGVVNFKGVPGRLERVREIDGVAYYNDTTATTPEATIAGIQALSPNGEKNVVLIMGGADKGLDLSPVITMSREMCKKVILLKGTGTDRIVSQLPDAPLHDSLESAVIEAKNITTNGDVVLFSPAFASFGMFANEYDRGEQFNAIVSRI